MGRISPPAPTVKPSRLDIANAPTRLGTAESNGAMDAKKARQERAQQYAHWKENHPAGVKASKKAEEEVIREMRAKWNASNPTRIPLSREPAVSKLSAPRVQVSKRMPETRQKRAPMPGRRRLGGTLPEMRSNALRWCEGELRELATKDKVAYPQGRQPGTAAFAITYVSTHTEPRRPS